MLAVALVHAPRTEAAISIRLEGFVRGPDGTPLQNASILLWGFDLEAEASTDQNGHYTLRASTDEATCTLYAFYDDPETRGVDLLPATHLVRTGSDVIEQVNFTLLPAATIVVIGQLRPIESARDIRSYAFEVVDPESGRVLRLGDYALVYGTGMNVQNFYLGLNSSTVVVPAGMPFVITVSSYYQYQRTRGRRRWYGWSWSRGWVDTFTKFDMVEGDHFLLGEGELLQLDIRKYSLQSDLDKVERLRDGLDANLTSVEAKGFYITSERHDLHRVKELTKSAETKLANAAYEDAYIDLRQAYLMTSGLRNRLATMTAEASTSVNTLIAFVAVTAVALASLMSEKSAKKLLFTVGLYAPMLLYLYHIYPGSHIVSPSWFAAAGAVSASAVLFATSILPRLLREGRGKRGIDKLGSLVAVFSMAKRNMKRSRLRSAFILTSILTLTMSFVALTSFSTGYGLVYTRVSSRMAGASGIMVRMPEYKPQSVYEEGWFYPLNYLVAEWVADCDGVATMAMKAENTPKLRPHARIEGWPIFGILGVQPDLEPLMGAIDGYLVEGEPLREEGTCLLSESLLSRTAIGIGDSIMIQGVRLLVVGAFESGILHLMDLDGESILPKYQINTTPGADVPVIEANTCEAYTVVITTLSTALQIRDVHVSRIDVELEPGVDAEVLGKSMALSREYRFWVSAGGAVHLAYMGSLVGGKGLPILVPWMIVILNVVVTMMNAMYERRREITILSSIGLNPIHISRIFLAEASIIGVVGGGVGYLLGLGWYPLMAELTSAPIVQQKVSAVWCLAALGIAFAAVVSGSLIALRRSVVMTPSLKRRWTIDGRPSSHDKPWTIPMPLKIEENLLDDFIAFITGSLKRYDSPLSMPHIGGLKTTIEEKDGGRLQTISFSYSEGPSSLGGLTTFNILTVAKAPGEDVYLLQLQSKGTMDATYKTGSFVRKMIITWTAEQGKGVTGV